MKKVTFVLALAMLVLLAACAAPTPEVQKVVEKVTVKETVVVAGTPQVVQKVVTATPAPVATKPAQPKTLVVCMSQEPESLYIHGTNMMVATLVLEAAFAEGPSGTTSGYDGRGYDYQPVIYTKLPSIKDGDAKVTKVKVKAGDTIQNTAGAVVKADKDQELDQMEATFKLKPGLKWSDGQPMKTSDFVFGYNVIKDKDSGVTARFLVDRTAKFEAKDDVTLVWTGVPGYLDANYFINLFTPLPEHVLKGVAPKDIKSNPFARKPVGFGPFRVTNWVSGDRIELEKNPNYWRAAEGLPKVDKLVYRFIPDTNQVIAQVIAGQCDIVTQDALNTDAIPFFDQAEKNGLLKPYYVPGSTWEHIDFNVDPKTSPKPRVELFTDVRVRQAVAYGTNRKEMNDKILFGKSKLLDVTVPATHWAYPKDDKDIAKYTYDPKKAEALLDEAGWKKGTDGVRAKDGVRLSGTISTTAGNKPREAVMQIFQANMKAIGIEIKLDFPPSTVLFGRGKDSDYMSGNFDLMLYAWVAGPEPTLLPYLCDQIPVADKAFSGQNDTRWCNKDFDAAYNKFISELDRTKRPAAALDAFKIFSKELPALPLYQRINVMATSPRVLNFKPDPSENELANIEELDVKQ
ncbi:MAG: peptide ABC transporter substrate-binding protein [Chloroflexota bacterium]